MLSPDELRLIYDRAYVPEHLPNYVESISGAEAFLHLYYLCFVKHSHLIFVGYPLLESDLSVEDVYESACARFKPVTVAIIAPNLWLPESPLSEGSSSDSYFRITLPSGPLRQELAYMLRRASRELTVTYGSFGKEHQKLIEVFIATHELHQGSIEVFKGIPRYIKCSPSSRILEVRRETELIAFNIVDLGSADYAFYLFNFRSAEWNVPGACDLLFYEMIGLAQRESKKAINLGLGINPGVRRFKEKWGAVPFLAYASAQVRRKPPGFWSLIKKFC